jgi:TRAP-type transport system small permease protein
MPMTSALKGCSSAISFLTKTGMYLSGIATVVMALFMTFEVAVRQFFGFSTMVADEWPSYLLVFCTFFGLAYTMETKGFLQVEFLLGVLSGKTHRILHSFLILLALAYCVLLDYHLISYVCASYAKGIVSISISQTPLYIPQVFMPIGMTFLVLELMKEWVLSLMELIGAGAPSESCEDHP